MQVRLESVAVSKSEDTEGAWFDSVTFTGVKYRVRPLDNPIYQAALTPEAQRIMRKYGAGQTPTEELTVARGKLLADYILTDWSGFDVEYSHDTAVKYLSNPAYRRLTDDVENAARLAASARCEFVENLAKN